MREELLTSRELAQALATYLAEEKARKRILYKDIDDGYKIKEILTTKIKEINENDEKINNIKTNINNIYFPDDINNQLPRPSSDSNKKEESMIKDFLADKSSVLSSNSPILLRLNEDVIIESIKRDIKSIEYADTFTDRVKLQAIIEAKRQGYIINRHTPIFMKNNQELIELSIKKDINSIDEIPTNAWTEKLIKLAKSEALANRYIITVYSPYFIKNDIDIIKQSLKLKPQSADWVDYRRISPTQMEELINIIIESKEDYELKIGSPELFRRNIKLCLKSLKSNPESDVCIDWLHISKQDEETIINSLIEQNYVIRYNSPSNLKNNSKICLNSIKNNINSIAHIPSQIIRNNKEIRRYLIVNNYYSLEDFLQFSVSELNDESILDYYLKQMGVSPETTTESEKTYYKRVKDIIKASLSTPLKISNAKKIFHMIALKKWEEYRRKNQDYYTNIFNRICDSLEKNNNFIEALNELKFLIKVDSVLDEKKYALFNAFIEYHQIYHSPNIKNKIELLQSKRNEISKNAALFISKSKEDFISDKEKELDKIFKQFFIIKINNPVVKKKVVEVKQRNMLRKMYNENNDSIITKIENIRKKYLAYNFHPSINKEELPKLVDLFISESIKGNASNLDDILSSNKPSRFDEYETYEKISKLINRLNNGSISIDGQEVSKYRDLIIYDGKKYIYSGRDFEEKELTEIMAYKDLKYIFNKIKSEIIQIAKSINNFDNLTQEDIKSVIGECPFSDEYYEYNSNSINRYYISVFNKFINNFEERKESILDDTNYNSLYNLFINQGLLPFVLINELGSYDTKDSIFDEVKKYVSSKELHNIIATFPDLMGLLTTEEVKLENLDKIIEYKDMFQYADLKQISLLGKEIIKKIYSNNGFTTSSQAERIKVACDLASIMTSRSKSTVPYINGTHGNYKYSMYEPTDLSLLTSGLDTNACFRCCANDNDFLHYCALDKNGFVIKITDNEGNFIGRASGFRNGNGVYINQLRTIYDKVSSAYQSEKESIISAFKKACNDIVEISQNNPNEENKIDFVVVTKSYSLGDTPSNVDSETTTTIGFSPMENQSEDWKQFVSTTKNLKESKKSDKFTTDFGNYQLICIKSAIGALTSDKIKKGDVEALYQRTRKRISIDEPSENIEQQVNRIKASYCHQKDYNFNYLKIPNNCKIINGDNWYIVVGEKGIIDSCYIDSDKQAEKEYKTVMEQVMENNQISTLTIPSIKR